MENEEAGNSFIGDNSGVVIQAGKVHLAYSEAFQARKGLTEATQRLFDSPPVLQAAALDELEAIGCKFPDLRQSVIDVVCAFLREKARTDNQRVGGKAQEILSRRLSSYDFHQGRCPRGELKLWEDIRIDLSGARLQDFFFMDADIDQIDFTRTEFYGETRMEGMRVWEEAKFNDAAFRGVAHLEAARFEHGASFANVTCSDYAYFERSTFDHWADFAGAKFQGRAVFRDVKFQGVSCFRNSSFHTDAVFERAEFEYEAYFTNADFPPNVLFEEAVFGDLADFTGVDGSSGFCFYRARLLSPYLHHRSPVGWIVREHEGVGYILPAQQG
ncbi:pentapeptide repeat-containing protein [Nocardiopsis synnemataformans]|uniref:pentapeptide repeat-containing protein n=1 Tax=Nocardiopsis synnemataformans TaxID=61305 RepID=UPI003EBDE7D4